jgi:hypothetical protein
MAATLKALSPEMANCDPGLKPNHQNHKINTPKAPNIKLCPGIAFTVPSVLYFPILGPTKAANDAHLQSVLHLKQAKSKPSPSSSIPNPATRNWINK